MRARVMPEEPSAATTLAKPGGILLIKPGAFGVHSQAAKRPFDRTAPLTETAVAFGTLVAPKRMPQVRMVRSRFSTAPHDSRAISKTFEVAEAGGGGGGSRGGATKVET